MANLLNRIFAVERDEWPKLLQFGAFGFLLQMGLGVGFSAGDAAFLSHVGADKLPVIFLLIPVAMLIYTGAFSYFLIRSSIAHMTDVTLALLIAGGAVFWALLNSGLAEGWQTEIYYGLKLYLAVWYIALYTLFWNFTDAYFDIQDGKRLFPIFAAFCSLGFAAGALVVSLLAGAIPMPWFMLIWSAIALATAPLARTLRRRWRQIAESDADAAEAESGTAGQLAAVAKAFRTSRYTAVLTLTLFVTLLLTNLIEFQYSTILAAARSEAELAALLGALYAGANVFNLIVCLFVFNRLVSRLGARTVAFILPAAYFAAFGYLFLQGGVGAAVAGFLAYHGVLTSIEYNNQNLLFNAVPSDVKRPLRTIIEGMCEPLASFIAGGFLLYAADHMDLRELAGIGVIVGAGLIAIVALLRQLYLAAMAANMRKGWLNFGDHSARVLRIDAAALDLLRAETRSGQPVQAALAGDLLRLAGADDTAAPPPFDPTETVDRLVGRLDDADEAVRAAALDSLARSLTDDDIHLAPDLVARLAQMTAPERAKAIPVLGSIADTEIVPDILAAADELPPRDRRAIAAMLARTGETAIPALVVALRDRGLSCRRRSLAAHALAELSYGQFVSQLERLVHQELRQASRLLASAAQLAAQFAITAQPGDMVGLLARAQRERVGASVDFVLELLALGGQLPNFDLLIVSLHSANAKVRANAIETIQSGVDFKTFRLLDALLRPRAEPVQAETATGDMTNLLDAALARGQGIEGAAAARALSQRLEPHAFAQRARRIIAPGMAPLLRGELLARLGMIRNAGPSTLDIVAALSTSNRFGGATLDALLALARRAVAEPSGEPGITLDLGADSVFLPYVDIRDTASRYPDLALVMLKSQDERPYAA